MLIEKIKEFTFYTSLGICMGLTLCYINQTIFENEKHFWIVFIGINAIIFASLGLIISNLKTQNCTDPLTNLWNRQQYAKRIQLEIKKLNNNVSCLSLAMLDIDNFKKINDTYGHLIGDEVLKDISNIISNNIRTDDLAIRWGGEEFIIILPNTDKDGALRLCERIRILIQSSINHNSSVTVSIGIAYTDKPIQPEILLQNADDALYIAKKYKNKVELYRE